MEDSSIVYLEILPASVIVTLAMGQRYEIMLDKYVIVDGRLLQPFLFVQKLQEVVAKGQQQPHIVIHYPMLAEKKDDERELITLQLILAISKLGWVIDVITDQAMANKHSLQPEHDLLRPFRPPVYQNMGLWLAVVIVLFMGAIGVVWYSAKYLCCRLSEAQRVQFALRTDIAKLEQQCRDQKPLIERNRLLELCTKAAEKASIHNKVVTTFLDDIVANIPKDCWLEALEILPSEVSVDTSKSLQAQKLEKASKKATKGIQFTISGKSLHEKSIEVFFSALLSCPSVQHVELSCLQGKDLPKRKNAAKTYNFAIKGTLVKYLS